jgi:hypothetical protein
VATFESIACRLTALTTDTQDEAALGALVPKLVATLDRATERAEGARAACGSGDTKRAKPRLKQTGRACIQFSHRLRSHATRKKVPQDLREPLALEGDAIRRDVGTLKSRLACPADAAVAHRGI